MVKLLTLSNKLSNKLHKIIMNNSTAEVKTNIENRAPQKSRHYNSVNHIQRTF